MKLKLVLVKLTVSIVCAGFEPSFASSFECYPLSISYYEQREAFVHGQPSLDTATQRLEQERRSCIPAKDHGACIDMLETMERVIREARDEQARTEPVRQARREFEAQLVSQMAENAEFIKGQKVTTTNNWADLLQFQSHYYKDRQNERAMKCLHLIYEVDPLYLELSFDLNLQYENAFAVAFTNSPFPGGYPSTLSQTISYASCAVTNASSTCNNLNRYNENLGILKRTYAGNLVRNQRYIAQRRTELRNDLDSLTSMITSEAK